MCISERVNENLDLTAINANQKHGKSCGVIWGHMNTKIAISKLKVKQKNAALCSNPMTAFSVWEYINAKGPGIISIYLNIVCLKFQGMIQDVSKSSERDDDVCRFLVLKPIFSDLW